MSSSSMDISESFRAEDLSKTDFFDFVTAPDMGIGIGVGVGMGIGVDVDISSSLQARSQRPERDDANTTNHSNHLANDGSRNCGGCDGEVSVGIRTSHSENDSSAECSGNANETHLHAYDQFWNTDKNENRLESTIFEDLDRYCWQQHQQQIHHHHRHQQQHSQLQSPSQSHAATITNSPSASHHGGLESSITNTSNTATCSVVASSGSSSNNTSQSGRAGTANTNIDVNDGQIYTITVLNGNEPWLKREIDTQIPSSLDLDSLLGSFPGYIKSEYPYDDSGFSTDGNRDGSSETSALTLTQVASAHHSPHDVTVPPGSGQSLPSLVTALSVSSAGSTISGSSNSSNVLMQQFSQFQTNNNNWQMANHNAEQSSAESLLRSALQGKGYSKGIHMQNGFSIMPSSLSIKEDDMRRMIFSTEAQPLGLADTTLSAAQIFDSSGHNQPDGLQHASIVSVPVPSVSNPSVTSDVSNSANVIVDDVFLSMESAFSGDFEKIKRIANEVQQFCASTPIASEYASSGRVAMQISPTSSRLRRLHSPSTPLPLSAPHTQPEALPPPSNTEVATTMITNRLSATPSCKGNKKCKRSSLTTSTAMSYGTTNSTNNNNNPGLSNYNISSNKHGSQPSSNCVGSSHKNGSSGNSNNNSGSPNVCNSNLSTSNGSSPTHCNGQRKERSLHYCSICSKGFKDKYSVNVHIRTHTGEKPFSCSLCGKSFRQKAHLAKHYQTHMAQKSNGSLMKSATVKHHRSAPVTVGIISGRGVGGCSIPSLCATSDVTSQHRQINIVTSSKAEAVTATTSSATTAIGISSQKGSTPIAVLSPNTSIVANR